MRTRSIAPGAARCPQEICAPSNAGPVGLEAASRRSRLPSTISAFVPDVDEEAHLVGEVRRLGEDDAGGVRADVAGDARQDVRARAGVHGEAELARGQPDGLVDGERERRAAERRRIDPEQEVVHDRVADERDLEDVGAVDVRRSMRARR